MSRSPLRLPSGLSRRSALSTAPENSERTKKSKLQLLLQEEPAEETGKLTPFGLQAKLNFIDAFRNHRQQKDRNRYYKIPDTPTLAYIEELEKLRLSPKSLGVVFPRGKTQSLDMTNYSIGNEYARCVSRGMQRMPGIKELNLTSNRLTDKGILPMLKRSNFNFLTVLNLSNNHIGTRSVQYLCEKLGDSTVSTLMLENTHLSEESLEILTKFLSNNSKVTYLNLSGNRISQLTELVRRNSGIRKLDLHWNNIRGNKACEFFKALASNESIQELDLSWNSLGNSEDSMVAHAMGYFFKKNEILRHLDLSYNNLSKDECDILSKNSKTNQEILGIHVIGNHAYTDEAGFIVPNDTMTKFKKTQKFVRMFKTHKKEPINCWVCEKWISVKIQWVPSKSGPCSKGPLFLCLDFNSFKPLKMDQSKDGVFNLSVAIPPQDLRFYFTCEKDKMLSTEYLVKDDANLIEFKSSAIFTAKPRNAPSKARPIKLAKKSWSLSSSLFKDYSVKYEDSFNFDLRNAKIPGAMVEILRNLYEKICELFKTFNNELVYTRFIQFLRENNALIPSNIKEIWKEVHTSKKNLGIGRHQFLELIVSCHNNRIELLSIIEKVQISRWREEEMFTEITDVVLKLHLTILETVFNRYVLNKGLDGFKHMLDKANIQHVDANSCYYMAIMTKPEDIHSMSFIEFLEAVCRVAVDFNSNYSFVKKLELIMPLLYKICPRRVQESFKFPSAEVYTKTMYSIP